jgi:hypothetical protein
MIQEPANQLFQFLRSSFRAVGEAHRTNPRRHTSTPARLAWDQGGKQHTVRGRLVDISRAGAAVLTASIPPLQTHARLRLVGPEPTPWIEASILGVENESPWRYRVRLKFAEPCPTYLLRVAVLGPVPPEQEPGITAAGDGTAESLDRVLHPAAPSSPAESVR